MGARASARDGGRLDRIYRDHAAYVLSVLRRMGLPERHLDDLAQDVFIAVHTRLESLDTDRPIRAWLAGFCHRIALDHRRRSASRARRVAALHAHPDWNPEGGTRATETRVLVVTALARLSDEHLAVLLPHDLEGISVPDVARASRIPLNTAYSRLRLGRRAFRAALERSLERVEPSRVAPSSGNDGGE